MTIPVKNAIDEIEQIHPPLAPGRKTEDGSRPIVLSEEDLAKLEEIRLGITQLLEHAQTVGPIRVAAARYIGAAAIDPGTPVTPGQGVFIACSAPGMVRLVLQDDSTLDVPLVVGASMLDNIAVKDVVEAATTADAIVSVMVKE